MKKRMNIFLPDENLNNCVEALDDRRLVKQILECYQIYNSKREGSYSHHPVILFYTKYPFFIIRYGLAACNEFRYRFERAHAYENFFINEFYKEVQKSKQIDWEIPFYYAEGSKDDPKHIRTTSNVPQLFRQKLCKKWLNDKFPPKWTKRGAPDFFTNGLVQPIYIKEDN